jgi:DNA-binding NarL/FixJ family response regulator
VRVVIGEDLALLRDGMIRLLTANGIEVIEAVGSAPELARALATTEPDVAIVDVRLPPTFTDDGLRVAVQARRIRPGLPILVLSQYVEPLYAAELLAGGASVGYLLKDRVADVNQFIDSLRVVAGGGTVLDPEVVAQLMARQVATGPVSRLTQREREVLALMAEGHTNAGVARRLMVTEKAVSKHINSIFTKLNLPADADGHRRVLAVLAYLNS